MRIYYVYPVKHLCSFHYIAKKHIQCLREAGIEVIEVDESDVPRRFDAPVILQPGLWILGRFYDVDAPKIVAVDVVETNALTIHVESVLKRIDAFITHSMWSAWVLKRLGYPDAVVVPHWVDREYDRPRREPRHGIIKWMKEAKEREGWLAILYHLWHSGLRKGAYEAHEILHILRTMYPTQFKPVIKRIDIADPLLGAFYVLNSFEIAERLSVDDMVDLYDWVDLHLVTSRAGGFELTAIESIYRGTPTAAPVCGCFADYSDLITIPLGCKYGEFPLGAEGWYAHTGFGWRVDTTDAVIKLSRFIEEPDVFRERAKRNMMYARKRYSWEAGCNRFLDAILEILR